jgi:hypothetical protein
MYNLNMLTQEDIQLMQKVLVTKEELQALRDEMRKGFSDLQVSVDAYAKKADAYFQEMVMLSHKVDRHEKWLLAMAEKLNMKLEY